MLARAGALGLVCLAVLTAAASASAPQGRLFVTPGSPVVGARSTIDVELPALQPASRLAVELVSPTGLSSRRALTRVGAGLWRASYRFLDDGSWTLSVTAGRVVAIRRVFVKQPPAAVPPLIFLPAAKPSAWGFGQGIGILIRP